MSGNSSRIDQRLLGPRRLHGHRGTRVASLRHRAQRDPNHEKKPNLERGGCAHPGPLRLRGFHGNDAPSQAPRGHRLASWKRSTRVHPEELTQRQAHLKIGTVVETLHTVPSQRVNATPSLLELQGRAGVAPHRSASQWNRSTLIRTGEFSQLIRITSARSRKNW